MATTIRLVRTHDARFQLKPGEGADAIHQAPQYAYAVALLQAGDAYHAQTTGSGLAFTLGGGNQLVCAAIDLLAAPLLGRDIEELMASFGVTFRQLADHHQLRWLGPHKGVVHLALAAITNACFDLWAKSHGLPLWQLLLSLTPRQIVALLDLSYLEDVLSAEQAITLLESQAASQSERRNVLSQGYPGYDTSVGWFHYPDDQIQANAQAALAAGFRAMKLKVGSQDINRDIRRAYLVRETVGQDVQIMLDANQQWNLPVAQSVCAQIRDMDPYWIEEPTHPDDVLAHQVLAQQVAPIRIAVGEHLPHRVAFKNFMQAGAVQIVQADCTRIGGVSEFLTVSLLARKFGLPVVPHVGDMGQIHQHLVLWNHIALGHELLFLEYIPHLRDYFCTPATIHEGRYQTPQEPGSSSDLREIT
jgi:L-fuconate dehydratase